MEIHETSVELTATFTYTQLKRKLAQHLGRGTIPTSTLSRWMHQLGYPKGKPGRRRLWDLEDLFALYCYGSALSWGYSVEEAQTYTANQVEKFRSNPHGFEYRQSEAP